MGSVSVWQVYDYSSSFLCVTLFIAEIKMPIQKIAIEQFLSLSREHPVLDVRSPGEYAHARIPGAHNLALFSDEERKVVGTTYKQQSRESAIKIGLDFFGVKMRRMVGEFESLVASRESGAGRQES